MVRLHTSLLGLTLATGLVLASSDDFHRRDDELFERARKFDFEKWYQEVLSHHHKLHGRSDTFDELEERGLFGPLLKIGEELGKKTIKGKVGNAIKATTKAARRGSAKKIEKKLKPSRKRIVKQLKRAAKQANKNNNDNQNNSNMNRVRQDLQRARQEVADADHYLPRKHQYRVQGRGLEDYEELSRRDLDAEEVFEREYDLLDERDTFDDLD